MIPTWPQKARAAIAYLYRPLQDVDIFVEDTHDEVFYTELFRRIAPKNVRVAKVIALGNRLAVVSSAKQHDFSVRRALFLVDGDFEWVRGDLAPKYVHRLDAYCIENILLHEEAAIELMMEEAIVTKEQARNKLNFPFWMTSVSQALTDLFASFAVLNLVAPAEPTITLGIGKLLTKSKKRVPPQLDSEKIEASVADAQLKIIAAIGREESEQLQAKIRARIAALPEKSHIISGKDYLMPLFLLHFAASTKTNLNRKSLRLRLARHCSLNELRSLSKALASS